MSLTLFPCSVRRNRVTGMQAGRDHLRTTWKAGGVPQLLWHLICKWCETPTLLDLFGAHRPAGRKLYGFWHNDVVTCTQARRQRRK